MYEIKMPKFGLTMEEGIIEQWFKEEGDEVKKGEPLIEVSSDKIINTVESPVNGILKKIIGQPGETYKVGTVIGLIETEEIDDKLINQKLSEKTSDEKTKIKISPAAKRLAQKHNIDIKKVRGSGPDGRIVLKDIKAFIEKKGMSEKIENQYEIKKLSSIRRKIAENLSKSYHSAVIVTNIHKANFTNFVKKCKIKEISITSGLIFTLGKILLKYKKFNSHFDGENLKIFNTVNIGVAVDTSEGLIVPVIKGVESLSITKINELLKILVQKARNKNLDENEIKGSTFSITNLGMFDTIAFTPVINPPEIAILGIGKIEKQFIFLDQQNFKIADIGYLSLSYDHRIIDGADAARFLNDLIMLIENPQF